MIEYIHMLSESRLNKITRVASDRQPGVAVVIEDVYDPHNAAAVLRTCDAFGIQDVYFIFEKQKYFNPRKVGKVTSASANKWLDFHIFRSTKDCLRELKKKGYKIYATVLDQEAKDFLKTDFAQHQKIALLVGNEHAGLSETAVKLSDYKIYLKMRGFVQSLNLSVTAALAIFEASRQRGSKPKKFVLPERERKRLIKDFSSR